MRKDIKIKILQNLLEEITKKYDYFISIKEKELKKTYNLAVKDSLTDLYNRFYFEDYLIHLIKKAEREKEKIFIIFIDLDNFKYVNDNYGHTKGDEVLKEISKIILRYFRNYDIVARYGGDEFVVLFESLYHKFPVEKLKELEKEIKEKFKQYGISMSYGVSIFPNDIEDKNLPVEEIAKKLIEIADRRMYQNKKRKLNR